MDYTNRSRSQLLEEIRRLHTELAAVNLMTEKRTTELYISEERFSLAMRGANDGLWDWNLETDEVYYSPRWKSMLGYGEKELDNDLNTWANLVHPGDKDRVLEKVQKYLVGRADSFDVEMRMRHKDGHEVFVLSRAFLVIRESDGKGVLLAIDDFGTGYSSFASLKHLKVDYLKIDKYFVDGMLVDKQALTLISSMIEMGHKLGYGIIAEGVEKSEQLNILRDLGCEKVQGYLFSKPVDADTISQLLVSRQHKLGKTA